MPPHTTAGSPALLCVLALCAASIGITTGGCTSGTDLVVTVGKIPAQSRQLRVLVRVDNSDAKEQPGYDLPAGDLSGGYKIGLRLPESLLGTVSVAVAALNGSDDRACILATTYGSVPITSGPIELLLNLDTTTTSKCLPPQFAVDSAVQEAFVDQDKQIDRIRISGWGFLANTQVLVDGTPAQGVVNASGSTIYVESLGVPIPTGSRRIKLAVTSPGSAPFEQQMDLTAPVFRNLSPFIYQPTSDQFTHYFTQLVPGDINGDGKPDLVALGAKYILDKPIDVLCHVLFNDGSGGFQSATVKQLNFPDFAPLDAAFGDVNGDGKTELILAGNTLPTGAAAVVVMRYQDGNLTEASRVTFVEVTPKIVAGRFRAGGETDFVVLTAPTASLGLPARIYMLANSGTGVLQKNGPIPVMGTPNLLVTGDFNGDKLADLAVETEESTGQYRIYTYLNNSMQNLPFPMAPIVTTISAVGRLVVGDLNKDMKQDLILGLSDANGGAAVFLSRGAGFDPPDLYTATPAAGIAADDFNRDGLVDLALVEVVKGTLSILYNTGSSGTGALFPRFSASSGSPYLLVPPGYPTVANRLFVLNSQVVSADVNADGKPDLFVNNPGDPYVAQQHGSLQLFLNVSK